MQSNVLEFYDEIEIVHLNFKLKGLVRCSSNHFTCAIYEFFWCYFDDLCDSVRLFDNLQQLFLKYPDNWFFGIYTCIREEHQLLKTYKHNHHVSKGTKRKQKLEHSNQPNQKLKFEPVNKTCHFEKQAEHEKKELKKQQNKIYHEKRKMKKKQDKLQQENFETCHFENQAEREKKELRKQQNKFSMKKEKSRKNKTN